jgi:hypothetical protein
LRQRVTFLTTYGNRNFYQLTFDGKFLIQNGGYEKKLSQEEELKELNKQQINSVIATNTFQKKFGNRSLLLAAVPIIFIVISTWLQVIDKSEEELKGMKLQFQQLNNTIDSFATIQAGNQQSSKIDSAKSLDTSHAPLHRQE